MNTERFDGHTPGPWDGEYGPMVSDHEDDADVLTIKTPPTFDEDKAWANQHLAAAAPDLLAALIGVLSTRDKQRKRSTLLRKRIKRLENALMTCAQTAGDDPFFNEGGEGYEALYGGEEE
tara:strand:+ start:156 stop:515 length:360 start_codon:yes stop_codon:yes gene_type:complete